MNIAQKRHQQTNVYYTHIAQQNKRKENTDRFAKKEINW